MIDYEFDRIKCVTRSDQMMSELQTENQNLRGMLLLSKDTYSEINLKLTEEEQHFEETMPEEVRDLMIERMDQTESKKRTLEEQYISDHRRPEMEGTMGKLQMAKLRMMLETEGNLDEELGEYMRDDLDDLYGDEEPQQEPAMIIEEREDLDRE